MRNEKIGFKIREHTIQRVPYLIVVGDREVENGEIAVRARNGDDLGSMSIEDFSRLLQIDVEKMRKSCLKVGILAASTGRGETELRKVIRKSPELTTK